MAKFGFPTRIIPYLEAKVAGEEGILLKPGFFEIRKMR